MRTEKGFTLIELLLVIGLITILSTFAIINLIRPQTKATLDSATSTFISDFKQQQIKSMIGDSENQASAQTYGVYIGTNSYTLFRGSNYQPSDSSNYTVTLENGMSLSTNFPSSVIVFSRRNGEINNFNATTNTITITNTIDSSVKNITINRYGSFSIQ